MSELNPGDYVRVTYRNTGFAVEGVLESTSSNGLMIPISGVSIAVVDDEGRMLPNVGSIEVLAHAPVKRITDISQVRVGDLAVLKQAWGEVTCTDKDSDDGYRLSINVDWTFGGFVDDSQFVSDDSFLYALRSDKPSDTESGKTDDRSETDNATKEEQMSDAVNHPAHYENGPFECIELSGRYSFCVGNAIKYVWRHQSKGHPKEDLEKALWYLNHANSKDETCEPFDREDMWAYGLLKKLMEIDFAGAKDFWFALWDEDIDTAIRAVETMIKKENNE